MAGVTITDKDLGMKAVMRMLDRLKASAPRVVVGIVGEEAIAAHRKGDGLTVVEIGAVHEFGAGRVPERSFLRATFDQNRDHYQKFMTNGLRREVLDVAKTGDAGPENRTLKQLGLKVEGDVKKRIAEGIDPPLHPLTIARKGSSKPLIDTGQLRASIASEIRRGGGA